MTDLHGRWSPADEARHADAAVEAWWWWGSGVLEASDGSQRTAGVYVGLELRGQRFDYWAGLVREGEPYLYIEELDGVGLRAGLELKPPEMWAGHDCDVPFAQWSLGNEAHGVLLDDPDEACRRAMGDLAPVTFDVEWYATAPADELSPRPAPGVHGYRQCGEVDVQIELTEGWCRFTGPTERVHQWGAAYLPSSMAMPVPLHGLAAPYRRHDDTAVGQVLTHAPGGDPRWWVAVLPR